MGCVSVTEMAAGLNQPFYTLHLTNLQAYAIFVHPVIVTKCAQYRCRSPHFSFMNLPYLYPPPKEFGSPYHPLVVSASHLLILDVTSRLIAFSPLCLPSASRKARCSLILLKVPLNPNHSVSASRDPPANVVTL